MTLKAIIFDIDGTFAETEEAHRAAFNTAFEKWDLGWHWDVELYSKLLEITGGKERLRHFVRHYDPEGGSHFIMDDEMIWSLHNRKTEIYMDRVRGGSVPLRPGIALVIKEAREKGIKLAIATTTNMKPLKALFEGTLGIAALRWFEAIAVGDMVENKKPAPDLYLLTLEKLGLRPDECIALEDSRSGLDAAAAAGLETVITVNTYTQDQEFPGALAVFSNLTELAGVAQLQSMHQNKQTEKQT